MGTTNSDCGMAIFCKVYGSRIPKTIRVRYQNTI
jgi:hypothetical protein